MASMRSWGWVVRFSKSSGFGFIAPATGGPDVYFHAKCVSPVKFKRDIPVGSKVTFATQKDCGRQRDMAIDVFVNEVAIHQ